MDTQHEGQKTASPIGSTSDLLGAIRSEIKHELLDEIIGLLEPKINEMLYRNIFNTKEAREYLKISERTLRTMVKEEEIPHFRLRENVYFRQWELDDYISKRMLGKKKRNTA